MNATLPDIKVFVDCADFGGIRKAMELPYTKGFTTNPSLIAKTGEQDYAAYARQVLELAAGLPVSFEVLSDTAGDMEREARIIHSWGRNVYVKVPVVDSSGASMGPLIRKLSGEGIPLNVTCVFTLGQARAAAAALAADVPAIVSVFAGRIADVGIDPVPLVTGCCTLFRSMPRTELLWASTREIYNLWQAAGAGCHIITAPLSMVERLQYVGTSPEALSIEAVAAFLRDAGKAGVYFKQ